MFATAARRAAYQSGRAAAQMPKYKGGVTRTVTQFAGWAVCFSSFCGWPLLIKAYGELKQE